MKREKEIYRNACIVLRKLSTYGRGFGPVEIFLHPETSESGVKGVLFHRMPGSGWERTYTKFVPEADLVSWTVPAGHTHQKATEIAEGTQACWEAMAKCLLNEGGTP